MLFSRVPLLFTSFYFRACYMLLPDNRHICAWTDLTLTYIGYLNGDPSFSPPFAGDTLETFAGSQLFPQNGNLTHTYTQSRISWWSSRWNQLNNQWQKYWYLWIIDFKRLIYIFFSLRNTCRIFIDYILVAIYFFWSCIFFLFCFYEPAEMDRSWLPDESRVSPNMILKSARTIYDYHTTQCMLFYLLLLHHVLLFTTSS